MNGANFGFEPEGWAAERQRVDDARRLRLSRFARQNSGFNFAPNLSVARKLPSDQGAQTFLRCVRARASMDSCRHRPEGPRPLKQRRRQNDTRVLRDRPGFAYAVVRADTVISDWDRHDGGMNSAPKRLSCSFNGYGRASLSTVAPCLNQNVQDRGILR